MATTLPEETFQALAYLIHADGRLAKTEEAGLRHAGSHYGLSEQAVDRLLADAAGGTLDEVVWPQLSNWQKALTYAFALWVAKSDGSVSREEHDQLALLGEALGLDKLRRDAARSAVYDIAALAGGHKPSQFDFAALEKQLEAKLPGSFKDHQKA